MATLITKNSQTASAVPSAGSLSTGELAVNTADAKLYTKHSDGSVKEIKPSLVDIANGGTGQTTASAAINALLPSQSGNTGKYLTTNGTSASWGSVGSFSGGTNVTSSTDVTLTSSSTQIQNVIMSASDKFVILPDATTLSKGGVIYNIRNNGVFSFGVKDSSGNILVPIISSLGSQQLFLFDNATSAGNWGIVTSSYGVNTSTIAPVYGGMDDVAVLSSSAVVYLYRSAAGTLNAVAGSISGTTITFGTPVTVDTTSGYFDGSIAISRTSATSGVVTYTKLATSSWSLNARAFTVSGNTITLGSVANIGSNSEQSNIKNVIPLADNLVVITYNTYLNSYARVISTSGSTITLGAANNFYNDGTGYVDNYEGVRIDSSRFLIRSNMSTKEYKIGSVSGTTITFGSGYTSSAASLSGGFICYSSTITYAGNMKIVSSGTTISSMTSLTDSVRAAWYGGEKPARIELVATNGIYPSMDGFQFALQTANETIVSSATNASLATNSYKSKIMKLDSNQYLVSGCSTFIGSVFVKVL